ncbi:MAG: hypothetical protein SFY69_02355 [Planctomycetota bacterium]|nr:hypothetical protein [Planctomycetota bacterium]
MAAEDFLCDFCLRSWASDRPMVEGHKGSLICAECLADAHRALVLAKAGVAPSRGETCVLCLTEPEKCWRSTRIEGGPLACLTCVKRSGAILEKDPDSGWTRPGA